MAAYFVCLDTSVLVWVYLKLRLGTQAKGFDELKTLIEAKEATLVVPQVTLLELQKFVDNAERDLFWTATRIESAVKREGAHVKNDLSKALAEPLKTWRKQKAAEMRAVADKIFKWLESGDPIKLTLDIIYQSKLRLIAGRFPDPKLKQMRESEEQVSEVPDEKKGKRNEDRPEDNREQDCFLIDSLVSHFKGDVGGKNLLFATRDNGFGKFKDDGTGPLDDTFQEGLPPSQIFKDLSKLAKFVNEKKTVILPTPEEVEEEKKREIEAAQSSSTATTTTTPYPWFYGGIAYAWNYIAGIWTPMPVDFRTSVKSIKVLRKNQLDQYEQVGIVTFYLLPVENPEDYSWSGQMLGFEEVKEISRALIGNRVKGQVGEFEWWVD